jgi:hypothetical protein
LKRLKYLYNKRVCPTKKEPQEQEISYLEREREGVREKGVGEQACILKVRLGLREIEGRDRDTERYREIQRDTERYREIQRDTERYREIERHRNKET